MAKENSLTQPLVSIIIVNYNGRGFLNACLSSLLQTRYKNFEIILVDNNSNDDSLAVVKSHLKEFRGRLKVVSLKSNMGFAAGNNVGLSYAKGDYVLFLNNDTIVTSEWLSELVKTMKKSEEIGVAQSLLLLLNDKNHVESAGDFIDYFGKTVRRGGDWPEYSETYSELEEIFSARGAALITRKDIIHEIGLFDPSYFATYEDIDFCWRVRLRGYKVFLAPKSIVYHKGSGTANPLSKYHLTKNLVLTHYKNYGVWNVCLYSSLIVVGGQLLQDLFERKPLDFQKRINALIWVLRNIKTATVKRLFVQNLVRRVCDKKIKETMLRSSIALLLLYMIYKAKYGWAIASRWYFQLAYQRRTSLNPLNH